MKHDSLYMDIATRVAQESYCSRRKVGSCIVTPLGVTLIGYNGTVSGEDNICETEEGITKDEVLHAESNALAKSLRAGVSTDGATLYVSTQPCLHCSKMIIQAGIVRVVFKESYKCNKGTDFLLRCGVIVDKYQD